MLWLRRDHDHTDVAEQCGHGSLVEPTELRTAFARHAERMHATAHGYASAHE